MISLLTKKNKTTTTTIDQACFNNKTEAELDSSAAGSPSRSLSGRIEHVLQTKSLNFNHILKAAPSLLVQTAGASLHHLNTGVDADSQRSTYLI